MVGITIGDAAGIGPEIVLKALAKNKMNLPGRHVIIGDAAVLHRIARSFELDISLCEFGDLSGAVEIFDLKNLSDSFQIGADTATTGNASAECIEAAVDLWRQGKIDAVCTAPISKKAIALAGYTFQGHTEFLASLTGTSDFAMSFFAEKLRVVLLSTHVSLTEAIKLIHRNSVLHLIQFADREFSTLLGRKVSIAVAGLNPHASEGGMFGSEEAREIGPAVNEARSMGMDVSGPYSPDTVFLRGYKGDFDCVVALYHDQATIAVKSLSFGSGVNVTLGLPMVRTSVDHGTAFDIAGKGIADASSMVAAIKLAGELALSSRKPA